MCDLESVLDARLKNEAQWNHFFEYRTLSNCIGITSVSHEVFPEIDKVMSEYLTPHILSAERTEMAQCLYFTADKAEINTVEVNLRSVNVTFLIITVTSCFSLNSNEIGSEH